MRMFAGAILVVLMVPSPALGWWDKGHKAVCEIAWHEMTARTKVAIRGLLSEGELFSGSCVWADEVKGDPSFDWAKPHHYVNLKPGSTDIDLARDCPAEEGCVVSAIEMHIQTLRDPSRPNVARAQALKFLGHLIGDVHQPLHAGYGRDRGGNGIRVRFFGERTDLHKVWDGEMIDRSGEGWESMARRLHGEVGDVDRVKWRLGTAIDWALESFRLAEKRAYRKPANGWNLGRGYTEENLPLVEEQLKKSGVRLAATLNAIMWEGERAEVATTGGGDVEAYYAAAAGLTGGELREALHAILLGHKQLAYDELWAALEATDEDPENPDNIILLYTQRSEEKDRRDSGSGDNDAWNREHVWPSSHGFRSRAEPAHTDIHHVRPADKTVNSSRGDKDFDEGGSAHAEAVDARADADSFEPPGVVKGDIARMLFYLDVRYEGGDGLEDLRISKDVTVADQPSIGLLCTLARWHREDSVGDFERRRNDRIFALQGNRNPFIDHPEFAESIWQADCPMAFAD